MLLSTKKFLSREKYYDSLYMSDEFNYSKEKATQKRIERITDMDQYYLEYKTSLKDTVR
ncbi:MAG: hypothetical protein ACI9Y7_000255 [Dokdonia sp.]|jgi:hypothetical protein